MYFMKYVYSSPDHICDANMSQYVPLKDMLYVTYMRNVVGTFVSSSIQCTCFIIVLKETETKEAVC